MKTSLRALFAITALSLTFTTLFTGCKSTSSKTSSNAGGSSNYSNEITVDVFDAPANYQGLQTGWYAKILKDKFNIQLNIIAPNVAGGGDQLYQTRSAAGNLGDLIIIHKDQFTDCAKAGLLYDMTPFMTTTEKDVATTYKLGIDNLKSFIGSDKVYGIPTNSSTSSALTPSSEAGLPIVGSYLRYDYYSKIGSPKMKNTTDLLNVLKKMQTAHPTSASGKPTYGFSFWKDWDGGAMTCALKFCWMYGFTEGINNTSQFLNADGTQTQNLIDDNGIYKKTLQLYYDANQMGLVDPDSSAQNYDSVLAKAKDGSILFGWCPWTTNDVFNTEAKGNANPPQGYQFVPIADEQVVVNGDNPYGSDGNVICIGAKAKDPQRLAAFINWFGSAEGMEDTQTGLKGLAWNVVNGQPAYTNYGISAVQDNSPVPAQYGGGNYKDGMCQLATTLGYAEDTDSLTGQAYDPLTWVTTITAHTSQFDKAWQTEFSAKNPMDYLIKNNMLQVAPGNTYVPPADSSSIAAERTPCNSAIKDASWKMVFAKNQAEFDQIWSNLKVTLNGLGYNDVVAVDKTNVAALGKARQDAAAAK